MNIQELNQANTNIVNLEAKIDLKISEIVEAESEGNELEAEGLEIVIDTLMDKQDCEISKIVNWSLSNNPDKETAEKILNDKGLLFLYSQKIKDYVIENENRIIY